MTSLTKWICFTSLLFSIAPLLAIPTLPVQIDLTNKTVYPNEMNIPFQVVRNLLVVEADVDDVSGHFIVDSGVDELVINSTYFPDYDQNQTNRSFGINGQVEEIIIASVKFQWEGILKKYQEAKVIDLSRIEKSTDLPIHGFIGYNILKGFEMILDYQKKILTLHTLDKRGNRLDPSGYGTPPDHQVKVRMNRHIPVIDINVGVRKLQLGLDSGAATNVLSPRASKKVKANLEFIKDVNIIGFGNETTNNAYFSSQGFEFNNVSLDPMNTIIKNIDDFNEALLFPLDGILGFDFLSQFLTGINFQRKELYLWSLQDGEQKLVTYRGQPVVHFSINYCKKSGQCKELQ